MAHSPHIHAKTPEQLMRSRFTAFKLGGYGKTTTSTYDANASGRNGYVKSCVQDALNRH